MNPIVSQGTCVPGAIRMYDDIIYLVVEHSGSSGSVRNERVGRSLILHNEKLSSYFNKVETLVDHDEHAVWFMHSSEILSCHKELEIEVNTIM